MKYIKLYFLNFLIFLIFFNCCGMDQVLVRHLKPPKLSLNNLDKFILCHRPMRKGTLRMDIQKYDKKIILNNYGHGGCGWTLGPGCAQFMVNKFKEVQSTNILNFKEPIVIIGAGILGLCTAYELVKNGYKNITIIAEQFNDLVSHNAGGFLAPSTIELDNETQKIVDGICFNAYKFYSDISQGKNKDFPANASLIMPIYLKRDDTRLESYEDKVMCKPKNVIIDFDNGKQYEMKVYDDGIFIDTGIMMTSLTEFLKKKVFFVQKRVTNFDEVNELYIFNCTGLGAKNLNNDNAMISVQGHLILLKNQNPEEMNYMISFYVDEKAESDESIKRSIYLFPKHIPGSLNNDVGVLGGTFIKNATNKTPNYKEFNLMIERHREFFGI